MLIPLLQASQLRRAFLFLWVLAVSVAPTVEAQKWGGESWKSESSSSVAAAPRPLDFARLHIDHGFIPEASAFTFSDEIVEALSYQAEVTRDFQESVSQTYSPSPRIWSWGCVVADAVTTYTGLQDGYSEANPTTAWLFNSTPELVFPVMGFTNWWLHRKFSRQRYRDKNGLLLPPDKQRRQRALAFRTNAFVHCGAAAWNTYLLSTD